MEKNIYFYLLSITEEKEENKKTITTQLSNHAVYELFSNIYVDSKKVGNYKSYVLEGQYYYDFIYFSEDETFIKIGKVNENTTIEKRNKDTLESGPIEVNENEQLDKIIYYYMDFKTGIASILNADGVGYGTAIKKLIMGKYNKNNLQVTFANIISKNIIEMVMNKDVIGTIEYSYAVPNDDILSNDLNVNRNFFNNIENKKALVLSCRIPIQRNKSAFRNHNELLTTMNRVSSEHEILKTFVVNAKNNGEKMKGFNLLKYRFKESIECENQDFSDYESIYQLIKNTYKKRKNEICKLINIKEK